MARITIDTVKERADAYNWIVLSEEYVNLKSLMDFKCSKGHIINQTFEQFRKKPLCKQCEQQVYHEIDSPPIKTGARTLAIDQATISSGWSVFDGGKLIKYGSFKIPEKLPTEERIFILSSWLKQMIDTWKPDLISLEDIQQQGNNILTFKVLSQLLGVLVNICIEKDIEYVITFADQWRSTCSVTGIHRVDLKRSAQIRVKEKYNLNVSEDEADAICLGWHTVINKRIKSF